ncbi:MAG: HAD family phosphatase [Candidatus Pacearchaeota archaeon]
MEQKKEDNKNKINAIIFDMNGVLVQGIELKKKTPLSKGFHTLMSKSLKVNLDKWIDSIDTSYAKSIEGKITEKKVLNTIAKNLEITPRKLEKTIIKNYKKLFKDNEELYKYAFELKKRGYKIAILSDQWHFSKKAIYDEKKIKKFDVVVTSCDVGMRKPNPKIYKLTLKKLRVKPHESIFVDNRDWNTEPAEKIGIKTVVFKNNKQAIREMEKLLE